MQFNSTKHNVQLVKFTDNYYRVTIFSRPIYVNDKVNRVGDSVLKSVPVCYDVNSPSGSSVNRAKNKIFEIATQNIWKYMVTLTLDPSIIDRYDSKEVQKKVSKWLYNSANRKGLNYLVVPERHKDGAIHFHGLFSDVDLGYYDSGLVKVHGLKKPVPVDNAFGDIQGTVYNITDFPYGNTSAIVTDNNTLAICRYITKYCVKDLSKIFGSFYLAGGHCLVREAPKFYYDVPFHTVDVPDNAKVITLKDHLGECVIYEGGRKAIENFFFKLPIESTEQNKGFIP